MWLNVNDLCLVKKKKMDERQRLEKNNVIRSEVLNSN